MQQYWTAGWGGGNDGGIIEGQEDGACVGGDNGVGWHRILHQNWWDRVRKVQAASSLDGVSYINIDVQQEKRFVEDKRQSR